MQHERADADAVGQLEVDRKWVVCDWTGTVKEPGDAPRIGGRCPACQRAASAARWKRK